MTPEWLATLAAAGAAGLVGAAADDAWQSTRDRFVRVLGRGDPEQSRTAGRRLDALRAVARRPGGEAELARARGTWHVRLQDFLEEHPDAAAELQAAIAAFPPPAPAASTTYHQTGTADGHGRVFMNQHGDLSVRDTRDGHG
ncbi:hypothetical protein GPA10_12820 [Streptomyces sp. p1417]|uniref:Uncharacterized protein n=1 Tax=Streptomyces typhae TaxID=2681492 RepID=A0A6L6WTL3_9ACTN|nr:hypothetical protein [Streptomyces typhae]MVO85612.1 hypothetical protein [Streptomyces typhae]